MTAYIIRRFLMGVLVLFLVTLLVFTVMRLLPADPIVLFVGQGDAGALTPADYDKLRHEYGLDRSFAEQYFDWMGGVLTGNLGTSFYFKQNVGALILDRLPVTFHLGAVAFIASTVLGIAFGVICALRRGKWPDALLTVFANLGITLPPFWIGILLIYFFSLKLGWLPAFGYTSPLSDFWLSMKQILMPAFCLSLFGIASLTRQTRSSMLEVVQQDYIRTAWAKGLMERVIIVRHTIKNALIPVVTTMGMQVNIMFGGAVLVETVFNVPGMGRLMKDAVFGQDYQVVQGGVLVIAFMVVVINLLVDISYGWFDPRIRYG
jgi:peptide/nickel transport system permease protein